jgi:hypothetical protein
MPTELANLFGSVCPLKTDANLVWPLCPSLMEFKKLEKAIHKYAVFWRDSSVRCVLGQFCINYEKIGFLGFFYISIENQLAKICTRRNSPIEE